MNTSAEPVPVRGTVTIGGTAAVQVADEREPFEVRVDANLANNSFGATATFTVPEGKRLVVEYISVFVILPPGQVPSVNANAHGGARGFAIPLEFQGTDVSGVGSHDRYIGSQNVLDFADGGDTYVIDLDRTANGGVPPGTGFMFAFVSGYLIEE